MTILSILAGLAISIAATTFLKVGGGVVGAFIFSTGLLIILSLNLKLFTGVVGYMKIKDFPNIVTILFGNLFGSCFSLLFPSEEAAALINTKLANPLYITLLKSIICGFLIYAAVESYNQKKPYITILAIMTFILFGAEHSIADACFIFSARCSDPRAIDFLAVCILGNAIGSILVHNLRKWGIKRCDILA